MKLIVGLGNPGREYEKTRHNIGFSLIDKLGAAENIKIDKKKFEGLYNEFIYKDEKIILLKPQSFINLSGQVVKSYVNFFKIPMENILIIQDDLDLQLGSYKLSKNHGSGGHNGIKNIALELNTNNYLRLKIGISNNKSMDTKDYVLGKLSDIEVETLSKTYEDLKDIIYDFVILEEVKLFQKYNTKEK